MRYNKKQVRKTVKKVGRKIYKASGLVNPFKRGKLSSTRLFKDVAMLKSMVNAEKKRLVVTQTTFVPVSQVRNNGASELTGSYVQDITPIPAQGSGYNQKTGNSIRLHSMFFTFQVSGQANTAAGIKLKFQWVQVVGYPYTNISDIYGKFISPNPFVQTTTGDNITYDINSARDPDYFKDFKVLRTKIISLAPDQTSGVINLKQFGMGLKPRNYHVKTNDNTASLSNGQMFMLITADRGNSGGTTSTQNGIAIANAQTGVNILWNANYYYYDN